MNEVKNPIDYNEIVQIIRNELVEVMNANYEYYQGVEVKISADLQYVKKAFKDNPNGIYIVVTFGSASVNFGQSVVTCSIRAIAQKFRTEMTKELLTQFSQSFNLEKLENGKIQQVYSSPQVVKNFETVSLGLESIIAVEGVFVLSKNANIFDLYYFNLDIESIDENITFVVNDLSMFVDTVDFNGDVAFRNIVTKANNKFNIIVVQQDAITSQAEDPDYSCISLSDGDEAVISVSSVGNISLTYSNNNDVSTPIVSGRESEFFTLVGHELGTTKKYDIVRNGEDYIIYPVVEKTNLTSDTIGCDFIVTATGESAASGQAIITLDQEAILALDQSYGADYNLDSQVMFLHKNFSSSVTKTGTVTVGFTSYLIFDSNLQNQALAMSMKMDNTGKNSQLKDVPKIVNQTFVLKISFVNGYTLIDKFKLMNFKAGSALGELPSVAMSFTN